MRIFQKVTFTGRKREFHLALAIKHYLLAETMDGGVIEDLRYRCEQHEKFIAKLTHILYNKNVLTTEDIQTLIGEEFEVLP